MTALEIVEMRMRDCSARSADMKRSGDDTRMYQLNVAWHWLDAVRRDLTAAHGQQAGDADA